MTCKSVCSRGFVRLLAASSLVVSAQALAGQGAPLALSPDTALSLSGTAVTREDVAEDDPDSGVAVLDLRQLPPSADVDAYAVSVEGDMLLSFDAALELPGGLRAAAADVVRYDGFNYTLELDGAAAGVPAGVVVDALGVAGGDLLISLDSAARLGSVEAQDEDLVRYDGFAFSTFFDGSAAGVPEALDLDAADLPDESGRLLLSFDTTGRIGGVAFEDEDVLEYAPGTGSWRLVYDGSQRHEAWPPADLDAVFAVPEPGGGLFSLAALLVVVSYKSSRPSRPSSAASARSGCAYQGLGRRRRHGLVGIARCRTTKIR